MEVFLAILMVLGIFIVIPAIIGFIMVAAYSGLFRVMRDSLQRRMAARWRETVRIPRELLPWGKTVPTTEEPVTRRVT